MDFGSMLDDLRQASPEVQKMIFDFIYPNEEVSYENSSCFASVKEARFPEGVTCPVCGSMKVIGHGKYRGRKRYKCKDCGKTFNDISSSPLAGTHYPEKWAKYLEYIIKGTTLPTIAKELNISVPTAFYWRHKVLNSLRLVDVENLNGVVESTETFLRESFKGRNQCRTREPFKRGERPKKSSNIGDEHVCVVIAMDDEGNVVSKSAGKGPITSNDFDEAIGTYISKDARLVSNSPKYHKSLTKFRRSGAKLKRYDIDCMSNLHNVDSYKLRLKDWTNSHFQGVSTRFIDNYLFWHRFLEVNYLLEKQDLEKVLLFKVLSSNKGSTVKELRPEKASPRSLPSCENENIKLL